MTMGFLLSTFAAFTGFSASIFFVIGAIRLDKTAILKLATPYWDYHSGVARTYSEQKWLYTFGAVLLVLAFVAQTVSLAPLKLNSVVAFESAASAFAVAGAVSIVLWVVGYLCCKSMIEKTVQAVDKMSDDQINQHEKEVAEKNATKSH